MRIGSLFTRAAPESLLRCLLPHYRAGRSGPHMFELVALILTLGLLAYLVVAFLKPEWFA